VPRLRRIYGLGYLHFITFSCYRRLSYRDWVLDESGPVLVNEPLRATMKVLNVRGDDSSAA
jgi:hypothetical protein